MGRKVVHVEMVAEERLKTANFYANLFGWQVQDYTEMGYTMLNTAEGEMGVGIGDPSEDNPGRVTFYIESEDPAADLQAISAAGGTVVGEPMEVPTVGTLAFFLDPAGNMVGLAKFLPM